MTAAIEASGLGEQYRRTWALRDCTLSMPEGMGQPRRSHPRPPVSQRPSARASCALFIDERPLIPRLRASEYSCSKVGPPAPRCERSPPRRDEDMSCVDVRLAVFASPERARSLFTVRAAISSALAVLSPRCSALALMCSYCRSRLGLDPLGNADRPSARGWLATEPPLPRLPWLPRSMRRTGLEFGGKGNRRW